MKGPQETLMGREVYDFSNTTPLYYVADGHRSTTLYVLGSK
jgi:hypothetical protein